MNNYRFMQKAVIHSTTYGWDILWFRTWHFFFRWFTDCGEWFIYLEWHWKNKCWFVRFSSAGFMRGSYEKQEH